MNTLNPLNHHAEPDDCTVDPLDQALTGPDDEVDKALSRWKQGGQDPDARAYLDEHPELAANRSVVMGLAFEEFEQRLSKGEQVEVDAFAARFPICQSTLAKLLKFGDLAEHRFCVQEGQVPWPRPGQSLLGFQVVRMLGRGAFARVYLAREKALGNRPVALKVSQRGGAEADILGRLRHDNIVPVYSIQPDPLSDLTVVCMPYLGSATLENVLDHGFGHIPLSPEGSVGHVSNVAGQGERRGESPTWAPRQAETILEATRPAANEVEWLSTSKPSKTLLRGSYVEGVLELGWQLAEALAFVHDQGIYHRDLKPSNVLVRPDGRPMLLDFNLSFDAQALEKAALGGTPLYMSPEQLRAMDDHSKALCLLDGRSDLYSLGVILYELLSGALPFGDIPGSLTQVQQELQLRQPRGPRSLREVNRQVDRKLAGIIEKCLAFQPADRYQTAQELATALRSCRSGGRRLRSWLAYHPKMAWAMASALVLLATVWTAVAAFRPPYRERQLQQGMEALRTADYARAADFFNDALARQDSALFRLARARAYQGMAQWREAIDDLRQADLLQPNGQTKACLGYAYSKLDPPLWDRARNHYDAAIKAGFHSAIVHNNLGYCFMERRGGSPGAIQNFREAIRMDPGFQLAYYNRALVDLKPGVGNHYFVTPEGLQAMAKVFEVGPVNGQHHLDAARLYAVAKQLEPRWKELALYHLEEAIQKGMTNPNMDREPMFKSLLGEPAFQRLLHMRPTQTSAPVAVIERDQDPFQRFD